MAAARALAETPVGSRGQRDRLAVSGHSAANAAGERIPSELCGRRRL